MAKDARRGSRTSVLLPAAKPVRERIAVTRGTTDFSGFFGQLGYPTPPSNRLICKVGWSRNMTPADQG